MPTLTARGAGEEHAGMKLIKEVIPNSLPIKNNTKKGYELAESGDGVDISGRMETHRGTVQKGMCQTINTKGTDGGVVVNDGDGILLFQSKEWGGERIVKNLSSTIKANKVDSGVVLFEKEEK